MEKDGPYGLVNGARLVVLWLKMYMKGRRVKNKVDFWTHLYKGS